VTLLYTTISRQSVRSGTPVSALSSSVLPRFWFTVAHFYPTDSRDITNSHPTRVILAVFKLIKAAEHSIQLEFNCNLSFFNVFVRIIRIICFQVIAELWLLTFKTNLKKKVANFPAIAFSAVRQGTETGNETIQYDGAQPISRLRV